MSSAVDSSLFADRQRLGGWLVVIGVIGVVAALAVGVSGWVLAGRATTTVTRTLDPISSIVDDVVDSVAASEVLFERTTEAIESIENATRSTVRTMTSVGTVLEQTVDLAVGGVAESLDAAVDTLPALISTSSVIDNTMRALSLVGVDYDPEVPLDEALADLEESLAALPEQIRQQSALVGDVQTDLDQIAEDGRELSAVLLEARLEMVEAERVLRSARTNAEAAASSVEAIEQEVTTYDLLARVVAVAAAVALLAASAAPLLVGAYLRRSNGQEPSPPGVDRVGPKPTSR